MLLLQLLLYRWVMLWLLIDVFVWVSMLQKAKMWAQINTNKGIIELLVQYIIGLPATDLAAVDPTTLLAVDSMMTLRNNRVWRDIFVMVFNAIFDFVLYAQFHYSVNNTAVLPIFWLQSFKSEVKMARSIVWSFALMWRWWKMPEAPNLTAITPKFEIPRVKRLFSLLTFSILTSITHAQILFTCSLFHVSSPVQQWRPPELSPHNKSRIPPPLYQRNNSTYPSSSPPTT